MRARAFNYSGDELIERAAVFHGHLGPYLVLGLKAGLLANRMIGRDPFLTRAVVRTDTKPPRLCFVDGVQLTTGCTMGKGNIDVRDGEGVSVVFTRGEWRLEVGVKPSILQLLSSVSGVDVERVAIEVFRMSDDDLFSYKLTKL